MPQTCSHCGAAIDDGAAYCPNCHMVLSKENNEPAINEKEYGKMAKKAFIYSVLCVITAPIAAVTLSLFKGLLFLYSLSAILPWGAFFIVGWIYLIKARKTKTKILIIFSVILFLLSLAALPAIWIPLRTHICGSLFLI